MNKVRTVYSWSVIFLAASLLFACAPKARAPESVLDNPEHHYQNGMKFFERGDLESARLSFNMAIELNPKYAPAHVGNALIESKLHNFEVAFEKLSKAEGYAQNKEDEVIVHVARIRVYSDQRGEDWLEDAEDAFVDGINADPRAPSLYYYMGRAHKLGYQFDKAADDFKKVLEINTDYIIEANAEWKLVQMIQRAAPGTKIGKKIALIEQIDRADIAALFIQELKLDKLFETKAKKFDTSFKPPESNEFSAQKTVKSMAATDIENHVLKADIGEVIKLNLRGLSPYPDHTFRPDEWITRANYAILVEDIIIAVSGDEKLATKFIGSPSPFPDMRNDHYAFNAIMTATSRGIMEAKNVMSGEFRPQDVVSGAEALLIIRQIKEKLKF